MNGGLD